MTQGKFLLTMTIIAFAMISSWLAIHFFVDFKTISDEFPIGLALILVDLAAFIVIGAILKKRIRR